MDITALAFNLALLFCVAYASIYGGQTGKSGSAIFIVVTILTNITVPMNPEWVRTSFWPFALYSSCLLALVILAFTSDNLNKILCMPVDDLPKAGPKKDKAKPNDELLVCCKTFSSF